MRFSIVKPWLLTSLYYSLLIALSSIPRLKLPKPDGVPTDKYFHCIAYGGLGFLLARTQSPWWVVLGIGAVLGGLDETYQRFIPGRSCGWGDWLADCGGVVLGLTVWHLILRMGSVLRKTE